MLPDCPSSKFGGIVFAKTAPLKNAEARFAAGLLFLEIRRNSFRQNCSSEKCGSTFFVRNALSRNFKEESSPEFFLRKSRKHFGGFWCCLRHPRCVVRRAGNSPRHRRFHFVSFRRLIGIFYCSLTAENVISVLQNGGGNARQITFLKFCA